MKDTAMGWGGRRVLVYVCNQKGLSVKLTWNEDWRKRIHKPRGHLQEEYYKLKKYQNTNQLSADSVIQETNV